MSPAGSKEAGLYRFQLFQDGIMVAEVEGANWNQALREIQHYALVYGQDGLVEIREHSTTIKPLGSPP